MIESQSFGVNDEDGQHDVFYVSGNTVYPELASELPTLYRALEHEQGLPMQITMGSEQAAKLTRDIGAEKMVPLHFAVWR